MKRSNMLLKIEEMLVELNDVRLSEAAEEILTRIENEGMLPPVVKGKVKVEKFGNQIVVRPWRWEDEELPKKAKRRRSK
ncbi:MAG: hypothetical protein HC836_45580 [Richelia sp. RM2_1_2]|nr:hypothetical protein [Richelia sp. RM2_1_2]